MAVQLPKPLNLALNNNELRKNIHLYAHTIKDFYEAHAIPCNVVEINFEPYGTQYCLEIAVGSSVDNFLKHQMGLVKVLAPPYNRLTIEAPIPGRNLVGITIPWVCPYPDIPDKSFADQPICKPNGIWLIKISAFFFRLSEKIGGPVLCQIGR